MPDDDALLNGVLRAVRFASMFGALTPEQKEAAIRAKAKEVREKLGSPVARPVAAVNKSGNTDQVDVVEVNAAPAGSNPCPSPELCHEQQKCVRVAVFMSCDGPQ